jgi:hypothetical protein
LGDVFSSSLKISPDGFDWIIEGRALLSGVSGPWPVLRNTNLVLISALDSILGQTGVMFAATNSLGILMQGLAILLVLRVARQSNKVSFFVVTGYYLMPLHFISLYVLADTIAVGTLMLSAAFFTKYFDSPRLAFLVAGGSLSLVSGLFQTYGLAAIIVLAVIHSLRAVRSPQSKGVNLEVATTVIGCLAIFFLIRNIWLFSIPHDVVPSQVELIELSLDMLPFYSNLWPFLFGPMLLTLVITFSRSRYRSLILASKPLSKPAVQFNLALGVGLILPAFTYQWPESRFSYTYMGAFTMFLVLLISSGTEGGSAGTREKSKSPMRVFAASTILIFSLYAPNNPWQPKIEDFSTLAIWPLSLDHSPQYSWYLELRKETCIAGTETKSTDQIAKVFDNKEITDPYTRLIGIFALSNCL